MESDLSTLSMILQVPPEAMTRPLDLTTLVPSSGDNPFETDLVGLQQCRDFLVSVEYCNSFAFKIA